MIRASYRRHFQVRHSCGGRDELARKAETAESELRYPLTLQEIGGTMKRCILVLAALAAIGFAGSAYADDPTATPVTDHSGYQAFGNDPISNGEDKGKYIRIVSFNIMAASWTEAEKYAPIPAEVVDRDKRILKVIEYLKMARRDDIDVFALQEVTAREFKTLRDALGNNFYSQMAYNAPGYWSTEEYLRDPAKWEPNGPAIFASRTRFPEGNQPEFSQHALGDAGNFCITMKAHLEDGSTTLRVFGVHLDDTPLQPDDDQLTMMGRMEAEALMRLVGGQRDRVIDIVAGDLNINLGPHSPLAQIFDREKFVAVVNVLNVDKVPVATSPYHESPDGVTEADTYDHILVRNAKPVYALVRHFGAEAITDQDQRAETFMRAAGSDHYPLEATVLIGSSAP
jgi:endonuclease/exonuclease/phosphatase family metal-dependent hydrolase